MAERKSSKGKATPRQRNQVGATRPTPREAPQELMSGDAFRARRMGEDVELPSGLWCKAKRIGMEALVQGGKIPNSLLPIVMEALEGTEDAKRSAEDKLRSQMDMERIADMMSMYDNIAMFVVVQPTLRPVPERCSCGGIKNGDAVIANAQAEQATHEHRWETVPDTEREHGEGIAYIDWVDFTDKVYLMNFAVGGTRDLEQFRQEQSQLLDALSTGKDVQL